MKNTVFIFDFDGTIADSYRYIVEISNKLSAEFNYKRIAPEEVETLKDKSSQEVLRHLRVPVMKIPAILAKAKKEFYEGVSSLKPFEGLTENLHKMSDLGLKMGILSSNTHDNIHKFLQNHNLNIFDFVHTTSKVWSKNTSLKKMIHKNGFKAEQMIYIGDEIRDIIASKKLGIKVAAVTWGYNSTKALNEHQPDYLINTPEELFLLCKKYM